METAEALRIRLPQFEGPLDLLYYLIRKHELSISEISLASIADEFVEHVESQVELRLEPAGAFLVTASTLMYLKSKWLLPPEEEPQDGQEQEGRVGPLLQQLAEYEKFRSIVQELGRAEDHSRATFPRPITDELDRRLDRLAEREPFIELSAFELVRTMQKLREFAFPAVRELTRQAINLEEKIRELFALLRMKARISLTQLFGRSRSLMETIVFFLAALELARRKTLRLKQKENFSEIEAVLRKEGS